MSRVHKESTPIYDDLTQEVGDVIEVNKKALSRIDAAYQLEFDFTNDLAILLDGTFPRNYWAEADEYWDTWEAYSHELTEAPREATEVVTPGPEALPQGTTDSWDVEDF